jgi:O-antigen ligase
MGAKLERYFIPAVIGFAPVVFALVTWVAVEPTPLRTFTLYTALPIVAAELFVIIVALREGLIGWLRQSRMPALAIAALAGWLVIAFVTSGFLAPSKPAAIRWTVHLAIHLAFGFSVAHLACRTVRIRDLIACYLAGFGAYMIVFVAFAVTAWGSRTDWIHNLPAAIHIRHVGIYAAAMTGISIGAMAGARSRIAWICTTFMASTGFALGMWTGSRGMVLSVVGATMLSAILISAMRRITVLGTAALSLAAGIVAAAWFPVPNGDMMGVTRQVTATTQHELTTGRVQIWVNVLDAIGHRPFLGYGPAQMPIVAPFADMGQPHNLILQILLDWGIAGLVCVLILAFYYARRAVPALHKEGGRLAAPFMGMISLLALSMIDAAMFHVLPISIFAACAGMIAGCWRNSSAHQ